MTDADEYDKYFQADHTVETQRRRAAKSTNTRGNPIRNNKVSALVLDPVSASHVFVAEATGTVRRVNVEDGKSKVVLSGPAAPLTSLAVLPTADGRGSVLFAGCWDKGVYSSVVEGDRGSSVKTFKGAHGDFVKCVAVCPLDQVTTILLSGSADKSVAVWNTSTGTVLLTLKNHHATSLSSLLIDPVDTTPTQLAFFSASSDGNVKRTILSITNANTGSDSSPNISVSLSSSTNLPIPHPTSIYALALIGDDDDLLTASADGSAAVMSRNRGWEVETRLQHGGHVRSVAARPDGGMVISGGRDEDVKVWDVGEEKQVVRIEGHFDEVMAVEWLRPMKGKGVRLVSASLDGTVRTWELAEEVERAEKGDGEGDEEEVEAKKGKKDGGLALTAEEEAELAELMDDSD